ncbi:RNA-directed DNA polymerase reverse transcriptase-related family protein [Prunus dulcis]|uniref:RNA-directed DNA polymerase reverse transcriptase-related family protein n=1 Tax=Prunus dulcis TaxID=3755 RepID=A0A4Y1R862_PRUDU|nr:RNA-directed DNA polymerase reverse transcriptase-related family protein [Prunus dulcis]
MAMKLDMAKAYDRVEWVFLEAMMVKLGFDSKFRGWIMECVNTVSYSVLLNGEPSGQITPSRGLRQGDPLSPFLFLICAEGLTALIRRQEERNLVHGFQCRHGECQFPTYFLRMIMSCSVERRSERRDVY